MGFEPFLGQIMVASFNFPPKGWALCDGQLLAINQNQALFALLGTTYGGDGQTAFALPDLRGRVPIHTGNGFTLGTSGGEEAHTLIAAEMPAHTHLVTTSPGTANLASPKGNYVASSARAGFAQNPNGLLAPGSVGSAGGGQSHPNQSPYTVLSFVIALQGIFPSRN
jgi:microcystin-dependent protein